MTRAQVGWLVAFVAGAMIVAVAVEIVRGSGRLGQREPLGVPDAKLGSVQKTAYKATYRVLTDLSKPWRFPREPAGISAPERPSPFDTAGTWRVIAGPGLANGWPDVRSFDIKAVASFQGELYVGIRAGWSYNRDDIALVFRWDGGRWKHIGGDGVQGSWPAGTQSRIQDLEVIDGKLYAAIGGTLTGEAEVWRFDGTWWELFGGKGKGWQEGAHDVAYTIKKYDGAIYVGLHSLDLKTPPAIFRFTDQWERVAGDGEYGSWPARTSGEPTYFQPYELLVYRGELYLGMTSVDPRMDVWRFDGARWERVAGDGLNGSWRIRSTHRKHYLVTDLREHQGFLIATLAFWGDEPFHPIWAFDGQQWAPVGNVLPPQWRYNRNSNSAISWKGRLYVGIQNPWIGASLWEFGGQKWRPVMGYDRYGSWGPDSPPGGLWAYPFHGYVYRLIEHGASLVAALGSEVVGGAQVWVFDPAPDSSP